MRFKEILETNLNERGLRMGYKDLHSTNISNMTLGFEFEIVVDTDKIKPKNYDDFMKQWEGYSRDKYIINYIRNNSISSFVNTFDLEPKFGWVPESKVLMKTIDDYEEIMKLPEDTIEEKKEKIFQMKFLFVREERPDVNEFREFVQSLIPSAVNEYVKTLSDRANKKIETFKNQLNAYALSDGSRRSNNYFYINEKNDFKGIYELTYDLLKKCFDYNTDFEEYYNTKYKNIEEKEYHHWERINDLTDYTSSDLSKEIKYVLEKFKETFPNQKFIGNNKYHGSRPNDTWVVEYDGSIQPEGAELITPPMPLKDGIEILKKVFETITNDEALSTNKSTGLHINIGTWKSNELDLLKLAILLGENHILKLFNREDNTFTEPVIKDFIDHLENNNLKNMKEIQHTINKKVIPTLSKMKTINFNHIDEGYIEFRASGGENYHLKLKETIETILRYARALSVAANPEMNKKEYLSKLYTIVDKANDVEMNKQRYLPEKYKEIISDDEMKLLYTFFKNNNIFDEPTSKKRILNNMELICCDISEFVSIMSKICIKDIKISAEIGRIFRKIYHFIKKTYTTFDHDKTQIERIKQMCQHEIAYFNKKDKQIFLNILK